MVAFLIRNDDKFSTIRLVRMWKHINIKTVPVGKIKGNGCGAIGKRNAEIREGNTGIGERGAGNGERGTGIRKQETEKKEKRIKHQASRIKDQGSREN